MAINYSSWSERENKRNAKIIQKKARVQLQDSFFSIDCRACNLKYCCLIKNAKNKRKKQRKLKEKVKENKGTTKVEGSNSEKSTREKLFIST